MKLDSKYFDTIRVKRRGSGTGPKPKPATPECAWEGCNEPGVHRAPMGRDYEGQYLNFCIEHVRQYNKSYNYFSGLDDKDVQKYLKDSLTGHRPTWSMGHNGSVPPGAAAGAAGTPAPARGGPDAGAAGRSSTCSVTTRRRSARRPGAGCDLWSKRRSKR